MAASRNTRPVVLALFADPTRYVPAMTELVRSHGFGTIVVAESAELTERVCREPRPNVLLLQQACGGIELCRTLRTSGTGIPIAIMVEGCDHDPDRFTDLSNEAMRAGANCIVTPSCGTENLNRMLRTAMAMRSRGEVAVAGR